MKFLPPTILISLRSVSKTSLYLENSPGNGAVFSILEIIKAPPGTPQQTLGPNPSAAGASATLPEEGMTRMRQGAIGLVFVGQKNGLSKRGQGLKDLISDFVYVIVNLAVLESQDSISQRTKHFIAVLIVFSFQYLIMLRTVYFYDELLFRNEKINDVIVDWNLTMDVNSLRLEDAGIELYFLVGHLPAKLLCSPV